MHPIILFVMKFIVIFAIVNAVGVVVKSLRRIADSLEVMERTYTFRDRKKQ